MHFAMSQHTGDYRSVDKLLLRSIDSWAHSQPELKVTYPPVPPATALITTAQTAPAVGQRQGTPEPPVEPMVTTSVPAINAGQVKQSGTDTGRSSDGSNQSSATKLQWWEKDYPIKEMAQNIGQILHDKNEKAPTKRRNATSVRKISDEIRTRIADHERRTGSDRKAPRADTIRGRLTYWKFEPK